MRGPWRCLTTRCLVVRDADTPRLSTRTIVVSHTLLRVRGMVAGHGDPDVATPLTATYQKVASLEDVAPGSGYLTTCSARALRPTASAPERTTSMISVRSPRSVTNWVTSASLAVSSTTKPSGEGSSTRPPARTT